MSDTNIEKRLDEIESRLNAVSAMASSASNSQGVSVSYFDGPLDRIRVLESHEQNAENRISLAVTAATKGIDGRFGSYVSHKYFASQMEILAGEIQDLVNLPLKKRITTEIGGIAADIETTKAIASRSAREAEDILLSACNYYGS